MRSSALQESVILAELQCSARALKCWFRQALTGLWGRTEVGIERSSFFEWEGLFETLLMPFNGIFVLCSQWPCLADPSASPGLDPKKKKSKYSLLIAAYYEVVGCTGKFSTVQIRPSLIKVFTVLVSGSLDCCCIVVKYYDRRVLGGNRPRWSDILNFLQVAQAARWESHPYGIVCYKKQ